ncbi:hypothetical protein Leryth_025081 [Lithospermum erythrorhizon]|nr:hypothetical protein Leryth_025081 [Lithospermum erythrorhizon]
MRANSFSNSSRTGRSYASRVSHVHDSLLKKVLRGEKYFTWTLMWAMFTADLGSSTLMICLCDYHMITNYNCNKLSDFVWEHEQPSLLVVHVASRRWLRWQEKGISLSRDFLWFLQRKQLGLAILLRLCYNKGYLIVRGLLHQTVMVMALLSLRNCYQTRFISKHTASVAAGNHGIPVVVADHSFGNASGMAPRAHIAVYKALYKRFGGFAADVVAAIDQEI